MGGMIGLSYQVSMAKGLGKSGAVPQKKIKKQKFLMEEKQT